MKRLLPLFLCLLLLCGCAQPEPGETTQGQGDIQLQPTDMTDPGDAEGIRDPDTQIIYLLVKMIATNDQNQELWGREYSYDAAGFCTAEREYSNVGSSSYSRINTPDPLGRIATSVYTQDDGSKYTVTYTYDDQDRLIREDILHENGTRERTEYTYNDHNEYLTLRQYVDGELTMDYSFSYTYDGAGNQVSMDEYLSGDLLYHTTFTYDAQGREIGTVTSLVNGEVQSRTESQWEDFSETRYFYSAEETEPFMVSVFTYDAEGNVVFEETRQGNTVLNRAEYIYEPFEVKK